MRSQEIDKQIEEDSRKFKKECKILLLGESSCLPVGVRCSLPLAPCSAGGGMERGLRAERC